MDAKGKMLITQGMHPLAQRLSKRLGSWQPVFGIDGEFPLALANNEKYMQLPTAAAVAYEHQLLKICLDRGIDLLLPLGKTEQELLSNTKRLFEEYGIAVAVVEPELLASIGVAENPAVNSGFVALLNGEALSEMDSLEALLMEYGGSFSGVFLHDERGGLLRCTLSD